MVQASLNHTAVPSLGNHSPTELFTGLQTPTPLREFYLPDSKELQEIPESEEIEGYLAKLRESVQAMHCAVEDQRLKQRLLNKKRERGENLVNFTVGDFVLRSRVDEKQGNKLQVTWVGPYRVVRADTHSFRVQHLVTGDELDVHASRLKMYADEDLEVTDELLEHVSAQGIVLAVDKLVSHRWNNDIKDYEIKVRWKGLEVIEDSYEPLTDLAKEIRILVDNYVRQAEDQQLGRRGTGTAPEIQETTTTNYYPDVSDGHQAWTMDDPDVSDGRQAWTMGELLCQ
uniref:Chromo domain-containing protein n=1 Tax=Phytophthora ramorum TaxID=164328 RepID=H3H850_PHYRM